MRDKRLENNIKRVEAFIEQWKHLSQFLDRGFQSAEFTAGEEAMFLELKSVIAREYEMMMTTITVDVERNEKVLRLLNGMPSLTELSQLPEGADKRLTAEWHSSYLWLQSILGKLRGRQEQLADISSFSLALPNVVANPIVILLVVIAAGYGVYRAVGDWVPKIITAIEQNRGETKP